jgi:glycerate 2-kinase
MLQFTSITLRNAAWGERVERILRAALEAVDPYNAIQRNMQRDGNQLLIGQQAYNLDNFEHIWVFGAGKAGTPMALAVTGILEGRLSGGTIIVKDGYAQSAGAALPKNLHILEASHPVPDLRGLEGARRIRSGLEKVSADDLVICLISGGGSALLVSPPDSISLADLQELTASLLACGATIDEINTLRKHLETLKGGGMAQLATPARLAALILSDVVGDRLDVIASGPTVADTSTFAQAYQVLEHYRLEEQIPTAIKDHLQRGIAGEIPETPKEGDACFQNVQNMIIGSNLTAAEAALEAARREGFQALLLTTSLRGEARQVGLVLAAIARQLASTGQPLERPACLVAGGETTVTLRGSGLGGRNQELALAAVPEMAELPSVALVSLATDGGDGPTDAAGAIVTGETLKLARQAGLDPLDFLARNDAYHFFEPLGDLLKPGPTCTNVNDLNFIFTF